MIGYFGRTAFGGLVTARLLDGIESPGAPVDGKYHYRDVEVPLLMIPPNWDRPVVLGVSYRNIVRETLTTDEERLCSQPRALYSLEYTTLTLEADESARLRGFLESPAAMPVAVPLWTEAVHLAEAYDPEADFLLTDDNCRQDETLWETFLSSVLIYQDRDNWEIFQAVSTDQDGINLAQDLLNSYEAGALVVPLAVGHLVRDRTKALTDEHARFQVKFRETFNLLYNQAARELDFDDGFPVTLRAFALADKLTHQSLFSTGAHLVSRVESGGLQDALTFKGAFNSGELLSVYGIEQSLDKARLTSLFGSGVHVSALQNAQAANISNLSCIFNQGQHSLVIVAVRTTDQLRGQDKANLVAGFKTGSHHA